MSLILTPSARASGSIVFCLSLTKERQRAEAERGIVSEVMKGLKGSRGSTCYGCRNVGEHFQFGFLVLVLNFEIPVGAATCCPALG